MSQLENDCLAILQYAASAWPRWVPITEITREQDIPPSTIRTIFSVANCGIYIKYTEEGCVLHNDVFDKIAKKYRYDYKIRKMKNEGRMTWHISAVKMAYSEAAV